MIVHIKNWTRNNDTVVMKDADTYRLIDQIIREGDDADISELVCGVTTRRYEVRKGLVKVFYAPKGRHDWQVWCRLPQGAMNYVLKNCTEQEAMNKAVAGRSNAIRIYMRRIGHKSRKTIGDTLYPLLDILNY